MRPFWYYSTENLSPRVTVEFLALRQEVLMSGQFAMEHQNAWIERADSFTSQVDVDAAMGTGWGEALWACAEPGHAITVDLGAVHDPTVIGAAHTKDGVLYVCRLITLQGSRESPVRMAVVKETIRALAASRNTLTTRIESWQGLAIAQDLQQELPGVELFVPTAKAHAEEWPLLAQRLSMRTVVLPRHARLREELLGLSYEVGPMGVKVTDRTAVHQDHAVVVRMLVAALAQGAPALWILGLHSGRLWSASGPAPAVSLEAERRQAEEDARTERQKAAAAKYAKDRAAQDAWEANQAREQVRVEEDFEKQREDDVADARRMARGDGPHWRTWR